MKPKRYFEVQYELETGGTGRFYGFWALTFEAANSLALRMVTNRYGQYSSVVVTALNTKEQINNFHIPARK